MAVKAANTKFAFIKSTSVDEYIRTGKLDQNDIIITSDTHEMLMVNKNKTVSPISNPNSLKYEIVSALPTSKISESTIYYLMEPGSDTLLQYMYVQGKWQLIGGSEIWVGTTEPPSDNYVLWIDPTAPEEGIPTADEVDIDSIWT